MDGIPNNGFLVQHSDASHMVGGAAIAYVCDHIQWDKPYRAVTGVGSALLIGWAKEYMYDRNAKPAQANMWGVGALLCITVRWEF